MIRAERGIKVNVKFHSPVHLVCLRILAVSKFSKKFINKKYLLKSKENHRKSTLTSVPVSQGCRGICDFGRGGRRGGVMR